MQDNITDEDSNVIKAAQKFASNEDVRIVIENLDELSDAEVVEGVRFASFLEGVEWAKNQIENRLTLYKKEFDLVNNHITSDGLYTKIIELEEVINFLER